jgi:hypothetical protein
VALFPVDLQVAGSKPGTILLSYACWALCMGWDNYKYNDMKATELHTHTHTHTRNDLASGLTARFTLVTTVLKTCSWAGSFCYTFKA